MDLIQQVELFFNGVGFDRLCMAKWSAFRHDTDIVELYNLLVTFQKSCVNHGAGKHISKFRQILISHLNYCSALILGVPVFITSTEKRLLQFIFLQGMGATPMYVIGFILRRWFTPCNAVTPAYFLLPECSKVGIMDSQWTIASSGMLLCICSVFGWLLADALGIYMFHIVYISFMQAFSLASYMKYFRGSLNSRSVGHRLLRCKILRMYRELQILNRYYNNLQQTLFIYVALIIITISVITGTYILIAFGLKINLHEMLLFLTLAVVGLVLLLGFFSVAAKVNSEAAEGIQHVRSKVIPFILDKRGIKWTELYWRSLYPLKVFIGYANFVEKSTPFTLLNFCLNQIVSLLLID